MAKYSYMVNMNNPKYPRLIRMSMTKTEAFRPSYPGEWEESKYHDAIRYGGGPFMDYDDCTEEQAKVVMDVIRENVRKMNEEEKKG